MRGTMPNEPTCDENRSAVLRHRQVRAQPWCHRVGEAPLHADRRMAVARDHDVAAAGRREGLHHQWAQREKRRAPCHGPLPDAVLQRTRVLAEERLSFGDELTSDAWDTVLNVNLRALPFIVQAIRADLAAARGGAVVGIASINATLGNAANPAYSASKGGMLSLVRSLADELAADGVRINAVSPGQIRTPMLQPVLDILPAGTFERRILLGRVGEPVEIARAVRFLLSADASYITATELVVDGGNISSQRM